MSWWPAHSIAQIKIYYSQYTELNTFTFIRIFYTSLLIEFKF